MVDLMAPKWLAINCDRQSTRHPGYTKTLVKQLGCQRVYLVCVFKNQVLVVFRTSNLPGFLGVAMAMKQANVWIMVLPQNAPSFGNTKRSRSVGNDGDCFLSQMLLHNELELRGFWVFD